MEINIDYKKLIVKNVIFGLGLILILILFGDENFKTFLFPPAGMELFIILVIVGIIALLGFFVYAEKKTLDKSDSDISPRFIRKYKQLMGLFIMISTIGVLTIITTLYSFISRL